MAYGKGSKQETEKRTVEIGRMRLVDCADLADLRAQVQGLCENMSVAVWPSDPFATALDKVTVDRDLLTVQKSEVSALNSVWREKSRMAVKDALVEQAKRLRRHAFGSVKNIGQPLVDDDGAAILSDDSQVLWSNIPKDVAISADEVADLQARVKDLGFKAALAVLSDFSDLNGLTSAQQAALTALGKRSLERWSRPSWEKPDSAVRLNLDYRCLPGGGAVALAEILAGLTAAMRQGQWYQGRLTVSGVRPRGAPLTFRLSLDPTRLLNLTNGPQPLLPSRLAKGGKTLPKSPLRLVPTPHPDVAFTALAIEVDGTWAVVKAVLAQPKFEFKTKFRRIVGRDFGYANTIALTVMEFLDEVDVSTAASFENFTKTEAFARLTSHVAPAGARIIETLLMSGRNFLGCIQAHSLRIDALRSEIDRLYHRIHRFKALINRNLGAESTALIPPVLPDGCADETYAWHRRLFKLLTAVNGLKAKRLGIYRSIDGVKKSWFGHLANLEVKLALKHQAAVVREHLTVMAVEKAKPDYKGRTFNKMINNGSKGQYIRGASGKFSWNGITEVCVPSFHTSIADVRYAIVNKGQRQGEVFTAVADGAVSHADLHAGGTIACWLALVPKETMTGNNSLTYCDKHLRTVTPQAA